MNYFIIISVNLLK